MHPRVVAREKVEVAVAGRDALWELYTRDISKGGMFVEADPPLPMGSKVELVVQTPDGLLRLEGEVVHALDAATAAQYGQKPGMGLQFSNLTPERDKQLNAYVVGLASAPGLASDAVGDDALGADDVLAAAHRLLRSADTGALYEAVGIAPEASRDELAARLEELAKSFATPPAGVTPPQRARIESAGRALDRVGGILRDGLRRAELDFRAGHLLVEERLYGRRRGEVSARELQVLWQRMFPHLVKQAEGLAGQAVAQFQRGGFGQAYRMGQEAGALDPFNQDLQSAIATWKRMAGD